MSKQHIILIVDDEKNVINSLSRSLRSPEYEIISTTEPKKAIEILYKRTDIDLIISDYNMPNMNGIELLTEVKELFPHVQRFILSAYQDFNLIVNALNDGIIHKYCSKPWDEEDLKFKIRQVVEQQIYFKDQSKRKDEKGVTTPQGQFEFLEQLDMAIGHSHEKFAVVVINLRNTKEIYLNLGIKKYYDLFDILAQRIRTFYSNQYFFKILNDSSIGLMIPIVQQKNEDYIMKELTQLYEFLEQPIAVSNKSITPQVHCGISFYPDHGHSSEYLTRNAQEAMYNSISKGRKLEVYRPVFPTS